MVKQKDKEISKEALERADSIDAEILKVVDAEANFIVEAGAGSGKTYSLEKVVDWLQRNRAYEYMRHGRKIACITFTNAAVEVIKSRLPNDSVIIPSTIHAFAWNAIKDFQFKLCQLANIELKLDNQIQLPFDSVMYTLGHRYVEDGILYLYHDDVIKLFSAMLDNARFRTIFQSQYPVILIDEYQDTAKIIVDKFLEYFINRKTGPQFGFFGDSWQTIYGGNGACGKIDSDEIKMISKVVNFRSSSAVVDFLNHLRPDEKQMSSETERSGDVYIVHCNDFPLNERIEIGRAHV